MSEHPNRARKGKAKSYNNSSMKNYMPGLATFKQGT